MNLTLLFVEYFFLGVFYALPLLILLLLLILSIGRIIGRIEGWSRFDSMYYAMITASTVGYGDFRPQARSSKIMAIVIVLCGLLLTGLVVALGVQAAIAAFDSLYTNATTT